MHKNDPYIVSLAASESNRRKELRAAGQAMQGMMQPQPKVADAAIAQMAPQEQVMMMAEGGIAALSAPNMQRMADGGIAGYEGYDEGDSGYGQESVRMMADGGVARYQSGGEVQRILRKPPFQRTSQENEILQQAGIALQRPTIAPDSGVASADLFLSNLGPNIRNYFTEGASQLSDEELAARPSTGGIMNERLLRNMGVAPTALRSDAPAQTARQQAEYIRQQDRLMKGYKPRRTGDEFEGEESGIAAREAAKPTPTKSKGKDSGKANIKPAPTPVATAAAADPAKEGIAALFKASTAAELGAEAEALSKKDIERMNKEYSPFLAELKAEKEALGKRRDSNAAEALVRAGLSIAGGKSRNALENIAAGAKEGFSAFTEANKADEAARRALRQSEMSIMQAQRAERSGYHKDAIALSNQARQERQFAVSSAQQAEQLKNTKAYQEGTLANQALMAKAALQRASNVGGGMSREAKLKLDNLKALVTSLKDELNDPFLNLPRNAEIKKAKTAQLAQAQAALAQGAGLGTMGLASPTGARGGVQFLGYEE